MISILKIRLVWHMLLAAIRELRKHSISAGDTWQFTYVCKIERKQ